jgi:hypothetical protein
MIMPDGEIYAIPTLNQSYGNEHGNGRVWVYKPWLEALDAGIPTTTDEFRALLERLIFCIMSYDDGSSYFTGKVNVGIFYTMNAPIEFYEQSMKDSLASNEFLFKYLNGEVVSYPVCDTLQVHKYSEYNMAGFSQEAKEKQLILRFPNDLEKAFEIAAELSK